MCVIIVVLFPKELKASLKTWLNGYNDLQRRIAERACLYLSNFVCRRGYSGTLHIDMEKKKLFVIVSFLILICIVFVGV